MRLSISGFATASATSVFYSLSLAAHLQPRETTQPGDTPTTTSELTTPTPVIFTPKYVPAGLTVSTDANSSCSVILSVTAPNPRQGQTDCGYIKDRTSYASVTVSTLQVDCEGCDGRFSVKGWDIRCPLGLTVSPYVTTVTDPVSTFYTYECSPTSTRTLTPPHVVGPSYTPVGLSILSAIGSDGPCTATMSVAPTATDQIQRECSDLETVTVWPQTISSNVPIDCGGCSKLEVRGNRHGCPALNTEGTPLSTVSVETASTTWKYTCGTDVPPKPT